MYRAALTQEPPGPAPVFTASAGSGLVSEDWGLPVALPHLRLHPVLHPEDAPSGGGYVFLKAPSPRPRVLSPVYHAGGERRGSRVSLKTRQNPLGTEPLGKSWGGPEGASGRDENVADRLVPMGVPGTTGSELKVKGTEDGEQGEASFPGTGEARTERPLTSSLCFCGRGSGSGQSPDRRRPEACLSFG